MLCVVVCPYRSTLNTNMVALCGMPCVYSAAICGKTRLSLLQSLQPLYERYITEAPRPDSITRYAFFTLMHYYVTLSLLWLARLVFCFVQYNSVYLLKLAVTPTPSFGLVSCHPPRLLTVIITPTHPRSAYRVPCLAPIVSVTVTPSPVLRPLVGFNMFLPTKIRLPQGGGRVHFG